MNYKKVLVESGLRMYESGLTISTWGNVSLRDPETGLIYVTPSGMDYKTINEDDVVVVDKQANIVEGHRVPTIETGLHVSIYNNRPEINAVVHTHPIYSTVFSTCGETIPLIIDEAAQIMGDCCKTAPYALPGSKELADNCIEALGKTANACLMQSHGAVCLGPDIDFAFKVCNVLEVTAQIYQMVRAMGSQCIDISEENICAMQNFVKNVYGQRKS